MHSKWILAVIASFAIACAPVTFVLCTQYSIEVRTDRDAYVAGEFVEISGFVKDTVNRSVSAFVEITVLTPDNVSINLGFTHSDSKGYFLTLLALQPNASLGEYLVMATVDESPAFATFKVSQNSITCLLNSSFTYPVMPILVYGQAYPARLVEVLLELSKDGKDWQTIARTNSNSSGFYSFAMAAPKEAGNYSIRATLDGACSSPASLRVFVKEPTTISISLSSLTTTVGKSVQLLGILNSTCRNATILIQYRSPEGGSVNHTVLASPEGEFKDSFRPEKEGTWKVSASWPGDTFNEHAECMEVELIVEPEPPTKLFLALVAVEDAAVLALLARQLRIKRMEKVH